jgi:hypothetical protein
VDRKRPNSAVCPASNGVKAVVGQIAELSPELRGWIDRLIVPTLLREFLGPGKNSTRRKTHLASAHKESACGDL